MARVHWLSFFAALLLAWSVLFAMSVPNDLRDFEAIYGSEWLAALCNVTPDAAGLMPAFLMWALMSAAMMAPTAFPALSTYDQFPGTSRQGFSQLLAGYLAVWVGFSVIAAIAQVLLYRAGLIGALGQSQSVVLTALLLLGAGLYQFSPLKEACVSRCRSPLTFFMQHWDEGPWRNGLRLGLDCLGCCWALMLLGFVGGVMNLAFMGLAMLLMTLEKLPDLGRPLTYPLGWALIAAAGVTFLFAI
jgi:predicted metal-binding membrane protein